MDRKLFYFFPYFDVGLYNINFKTISIYIIYIE